MCIIYLPVTLRSNEGGETMALGPRPEAEAANPSAIGRIAYT